VGVGAKLGDVEKGTGPGVGVGASAGVKLGEGPDPEDWPSARQGAGARSTGTKFATTTIITIVSRMPSKSPVNQFII
jgi:hypothetical protein